ncbi:MAG: hypothetical protein NVS3B25_11950 [Hymenobacter sp.]
MRYAFLLPLSLLLSCASTDRPVADTPESTSTTPQISRVFDVPALLGMNANQIVKPLTGPSTRSENDPTPRETSAGNSEVLRTYWRDTTALEVSYNPQTLHVNSYFVKTKSGHTKDYTNLLKLANVSRFDKRVTIEPVPTADNPQVYTGVRIVPQQ